jgi:surface protein
VLRVSNFVSAFGSTTALSDCNKKAIHSAWGATLQGVYPTFDVYCITNANIGTAATAWVTDPATAAATYGNIGDWNTAAVSSMYQLFYNQPTFNADVSKWNVASVSNIASMFSGTSVFNQNVGSWNTASVTTMYATFNSATAFNQNLASWNVLCVTTLNSAFDSTTALSATNKLALYQAWGATLQAAYPSWTASPTARSRSRRSRPTCYTRAHTLRTHRREST